MVIDRGHGGRDPARRDLRHPSIYDQRHVRYRRPVLLIAVLLGLTAALNAVRTPPRAEEPLPPPSVRSEAPRRPPAPSLATVTFAAEEPRTRRVRPGAHVSVRVTVKRPGEVAIPELGLIQSATPGAPVTFDLLTQEPQQLPLTFTPIGEGERPAGTLSVDR